MIVEIDCSKIHDENSFHQVFKDAFGFPDFYGMNFNAWIDCMTYLDDSDAGMSKIHLVDNDICILQLVGVESFYKRDKELFLRINTLVAFVNFRRVEVGERAILALSYHI